MRMRHKYLLLVLLLFTQISCNEWLDLLPPNGLIRDEFWQSKEDVEAVLMAAYDGLAGMDADLFLHGELRADLLLGGQNQPLNEQNIMESNIYPDNPFCDWSPFYSIINNCNEVIKNGPLVREIDDTFTEFKLRSLLAEAYFLRSLTYFYLVRIYNEVPLALEPFEADNVDFYLPKSTEEEILDQIVSDLVEYREFALTEGFPTLESNKGRASKGAFDALLADIELWRFNYEEVIRYVDRIELTEKYELMPSSSWFEIFYPGNSLESIFELQFDANLNQSNNVFPLVTRFSQRYFASQTAINMFSLDNSQEIVRGEDATVARIGEDEFAIWKQVGQAADGTTTRTGSDQRSANWIIYRYADVLLMKAEALSQLQRYDEALFYLNLIKGRAGLPQVAILNSPLAFEDAIMEQRALEFAYEGKRWFDLLRLGRRNNFARKEALLEIIVSNVPTTQKRILAAKLTNPQGWYLPVYETEIERNKNIEQNPFYDY